MALRILRASALVCLLGACTVVPLNNGDSTSANTEIESGGATNSEVSPARAHAGTAGRTSSKPLAKGGSSGEVGGSSSAGRAPNDDAAGTGGAAGAAEPPPPCDLNGNCTSDGDGEKVTCGVVSGNECEFAGFVGATAQVAWGKSAMIGLACCGQCECVPVEVYFDGVRCWQGIPQCANNQFITPHPTTTPNPAFAPNKDAYGSFYLGSGGFGGSPAEQGEGTAGTAGTNAVPLAGTGGIGGCNEGEDHAGGGTSQGDRTRD